MSIISDLILVGELEVSKLDFDAAKTSSQVIIITNKLIMKFNLKRFTFFIVIALAIIFISFKLPKTGDEIARNQGLSFNSDFKNYNRILDIFDEEDNKVASFKVALADDDKKRMYGLMYLKELPKNHGMIFTFFPSRVVTMWMKNTFIPLDIIFVDSDNEIAHIAENTTPQSLELISSRREVVMVIEINAGLAKELGIKVGQTVRAFNQEK
jgi:uncharacterized membrane protein (UPF0127 family)